MRIFWRSLHRIKIHLSKLTTLKKLLKMDRQPILEMERERKFPQYLAAILANIIGISWGSTIGWSSPAIAKMTNENDLTESPLDFIPSADQQSWIGALLPLGGLVGPSIAASLTDYIGRKWSLMLNSLVFIASFAILLFTNDLLSIYVARFLQGMASGAVMVILPIYCGEIASPDCRGILSGFIQIGLVVGIMFSYCIGPYVSYIMFQFLCLIIPLVFIITFIFMPETPYFYLMKSHRIKAIKSLQFLRGSSAESILPEMRIIQESIETSMNQRSTLRDMFSSQANRTALIIGVGLISFQNFAGIDAVLFYSETIFDEADGSIDSAVSTIIVGLVMLLSSCISPFFVDRTGRRGLLLVSAAGMAISLTIMGIYFFFDERDADFINSLGWLPIVALVGFILFYCVGFGPLPFTILSEMFSTEFKSLGGSISVSACWLVDFCVTKSFLPLSVLIGSAGCFWAFAGLCIIAFMFTWKFVFETKGLSLEQIQIRLNKNRTI